MTPPPSPSAPPSPRTPIPLPPLLRLPQPVQRSISSTFSPHLPHLPTIPSIFTTGHLSCPATVSLPAQSAIPSRVPYQPVRLPVSGSPL
ncbi:hypothetical protein E2C01_036554 [Portunus trituberculatus]|uniref:Uncharacterized protein n=1 Tax=Portunus trituberculatus TaxID=210409 RepID=A0A5B7F6Z9_PORTR|nr:hypothetical protein [Portunus trituberculatus]